MGTTIANEDMARAWDEEGRAWAAEAEHYDRATAAHQAALAEAAAVAAGERVLDLGCGCGRSTLEAAMAAGSGGAEGSALGLDLSADMLDVARARAQAEGIANAAFEQGDAQVHDLGEDTVDVAISRYGASFFANPVAAFANVARALRPDGRLAVITWQELEANDWIRSFRLALARGRDLPAPPTGAPGPFGLADPAAVRAWLGEAGFGEVEVDGVHAPMWFGADADDALAFLLGQGSIAWMLADLDEEGRAAGVAALRAVLAAHEGAEGVVFDSASWLIHARRR